MLKHLATLAEPFTSSKVLYSKVAGSNFAVGCGLSCEKEME